MLSGRKIKVTPQFVADLQFLKKLDPTINAEIMDCLEILREEGQLPPEFQDHGLHGNLSGYREFHVRDTPHGSKPAAINDVLVMYRWKHNLLVIVAVAAGSHDKLFSSD